MLDSANASNSANRATQWESEAWRGFLCPSLIAEPAGLASYSILQSESGYSVLDVPILCSPNLGGMTALRWTEIPNLFRDSAATPV